MKLIIVRHGQTEENVKKIIQGHKYGRLTEYGKEQAKKAGERLKNEKIDIIYVSDLQRTIDTANEIIKYHKNTQVIYEPRIREKGWGEFEGKTGEYLKKYIKENNLDYHKFKPGGGESYDEFRNRIIDFYDYLVNKYENDTILLVSHSGAISNMLLHIFSDSVENYRKYHPENTAITILEIEGKKLKKTHKLNSVEHLY
jgi:broad specificity phosphatase PhoE